MLEFKKILFQVISFLLIWAMFLPGLEAWPEAKSSDQSATLSPSMELNAGMFQKLFQDSCVLVRDDQVLKEELSRKPGEEYQVLVRVYDSRIDIEKAEGMSAYFIEEVFKRVFEHLSRRKVWSDFPNFNTHNDFSFGFRAGQKEFFIIDRKNNTVSLPLSLLDNFSALLFTVRHVIHRLNHPKVDNRRILNADAFFFLKLFDYERKEILQGTELSAYENRELLSQIESGVRDNDFSLLSRLLLNEPLDASANEELKRSFLDLTQGLRGVNVSKGRMLNFTLLLWNVCRRNHSPNKAAEAFAKLIYGLKNIPGWSRFIPEANAGVFIIKLDQLLSESQFGMHHAKVGVKYLLENTVVDTLLYFQRIEAQARQYPGGKGASYRMKHSASVRGAMGEISGLHKYTFVFNDTLRILKEKPEIDSRNKVYVSCSLSGEAVSKECDAHTAGTILEFKYTTHYRDIYRQIAGYMKPVSVFSLLLNAHQKKEQSQRSKNRIKMSNDDRELASVKNVVYFAENDASDLAYDVYQFVLKHKNSFDQKTRLSLLRRTFWNEDGFSARLNLQEFKKLLLDENMIQGFWAEREDRQVKSTAQAEQRHREYLRRYFDQVFPELERIYARTGFDFYISISNPKIKPHEESFVYSMSLSDDIASNELIDLRNDPASKFFGLIEQAI